MLPIELNWSHVAMMPIAKAVAAYLLSIFLMNAYVYSQRRYLQV